MSNIIIIIAVALLLRSNKKQTARVMPRPEIRNQVNETTTSGAVKGVLN